MKKQITITEQKSRQVEVEVPSFHNFHGRYSAITEHSVMMVWENHMITYELASNKDRYNNAIDDVLKYSSSVFCTKEEFETAFNNTIKCLTEQYQLSMSMILGPNTQTAEGQEQQVAATESAAQDNAMEVSAEEGGTEG
jgi:hypothetical protein